MSSLHIRLREQEKAIREFREQALELEKDIGMRVPVRFLDVRVRLLEELIEKTGGSLVTQSGRDWLCELKKRVALRTESQRRSLSGSNLKVVS